MLTRSPDHTCTRRAPESVMTLERLGCSFPTRLSFMPTLLRRLARERWRIGLLEDGLDKEGYGHRVYTASGPSRTYSLVALSHHLEPEQRNDRVIAEAWDATFALFDGVPTGQDLSRLKASVGRQEMARFLPSELVLSRANRSVRIFDHVVARLAEGEQPDRDLIINVGYLFRTTAVYGNGKFGLADRYVYDAREELAGPFQAEFLAVYLIREFTLDLVEHIARSRGGTKAVPLEPDIRRFLGIGNSTGLGMAPFLVNHPALISTWVEARETALATVRARGGIERHKIDQFRDSIDRARQHLAQWRVDDRLEFERIRQAESDLAGLGAWLAGAKPDPRYWDSVWAQAGKYGSYTQELVISLMLAPHGDLIDDLTRNMAVRDPPPLDPSQSLRDVMALVEEHYHWAVDLDLTKPEATRHFWYVSEEKQEPRLGDRFLEDGAERELRFNVAKDVQALHKAASGMPPETPVGALLVHHPDLVDIVQRIQTIDAYPYGEIRANLVDAACQPLDILRCKLAFFGAGRFDPKSEKWLRIALYQGAPLAAELGSRPDDDWLFATLPVNP